MHIGYVPLAWIEILSWLVTGWGFGCRNIRRQVPAQTLDIKEKSDDLFAFKDNGNAIP